VKCWGDNFYGQLGYGDVRDRGGSPADMGSALPTVDLGTGRTAIKIAAGAYNTCAVLDDSTLKCWGAAALDGRPYNGDIGDRPGEMGDDLKPLSFGGGKVLNVGIGSEAACASFDDNTIWCWSGDTAGIPKMVTGLPSKSVKELSPIFNTVVALYDDGTISGSLPGNQPLVNLSAAGSNHKIVAISGDTTENCEVLDDGSMFCLGEKATATTVAATSVGVEYGGSYAVATLFADGSVLCSPDPGALVACSPEIAYWCDPTGTVALGKGASAITSGGQSFTCALLADGGIKCWDFEAGSPAWLGSGVSVLSGTSASVEYGPWNEIDLGSHL